VVGLGYGGGEVGLGGDPGGAGVGEVSLTVQGVRRCSLRRFASCCSMCTWWSGNWIWRVTRRLNAGTRWRWRWSTDAMRRTAHRSSTAMKATSSQLKGRDGEAYAHERLIRQAQALTLAGGSSDGAGGARRGKSCGAMARRLPPCSAASAEGLALN